MSSEKLCSELCFLAIRTITQSVRWCSFWLYNLERVESPETIEDILELFGTIYDHLWPLRSMLGLLRPFGTIWDSLGPFRTIKTIRYYLGLFQKTCDHLEPFGTIWEYFRPIGTTWDHLGTFETLWNILGPFRTIWHHMDREPGKSGEILERNWGESRERVTRDWI